MSSLVSATLWVLTVGQSMQDIILRGIEEGVVQLDTRSNLKDPLLVRSIINDTLEVCYPFSC